MIDTFEDRLKKICAARSLSIPQVCDMAGLKYKTLNAQIARKSRIPLDTVDDICHALDIPISYFSKHAPSMGISPEHEGSRLAGAAANLIDAAMHTAHMETLRRQSTIGTTDVLNWLARTGGRLEDFDALQESVDLFRVMGSEDRTPTPFRIGHQSANSTEFKIKSNEQYSALLGAFPDDFLEGIKLGHIEASHRPYMVSDVEMNGEVGGRLVKTKYRRIHAKVYLPDGEPLTMIHAVFIPSSHWSNSESSHLDLIQRHPNHADAHQEA
ncbi:MAG: helix-turn-helix transcriptional regulator [Roseobacter sp.]